MAYGAALVFLASLTAEDIKEKRLSLAKIILFGVLGLFYLLFKTEYDIGAVFIAGMPGMLLLTLACLTKESIGYGDGLVVMVLGFWTGGAFALRTLWLAVSIAGIVGLIRLFGKKKDSMPFVPFLLLAMVIMIAFR